MMGTRVLLAALLGAVVLFFWTAASWMVMPWSDASLLRFENEPEVHAAVVAGAPASGIYVLPYLEEGMPTDEPMIFSSVRLEGPRPMGVAMGGQFVLNLVAMLIAALLLVSARPRSYGARVLFVTALGFLGWLIISAPHFLWWGFSAAFTLTELVNTVIGWALAGLVLAWLLAPRASTPASLAEAERSYDAA